jgi:transcriptional regulator GlxA family with amidase domain
VVLSLDAAGRVLADGAWSRCKHRRNGERGRPCKPHGMIAHVSRTLLPDTMYHRGAAASVIQRAKGGGYRGHLPERVSGEVVSLLQLESSIDQSVVAHRLGLSERTLQRRLEEAGRSFRSIVDTASYQFVLELMQDSTLGLAEVARACGFRNQAALSRAFRRWTGRSPMEYRRTRTAPPSRHRNSQSGA